MKNYFANLTTEAEITNVYKALRVALHPDNGGNTAAFQALGQQYEAALAAIRHDAASDKGGELPTAVICLPGCSCVEPAAQRLADITDELSSAVGITIELCGTWIWISGDTKPVKDQLKALGCRFSGNKKRWYWHDGSYKRRRRGHSWDMEDIRRKYGSEVLA